MTVTRRVSVERNRLRFAAAHMATFLDDCEPLHGHNYDVSVEVTGDLTRESWVWDFGDLKRTTKAIIDELDHRFLLQTQSKLLEIEEGSETWTLRFRDRRYEFPKPDVAALPIDNSTAERLAEWVAARLIAELEQRGTGNLTRLSVGIEEMPGQAGWYTVDL
jgi:6-pyruvoyltetrahydropterin/6-carboxytetrahydropterin synthase